MSSNDEWLRLINLLLFLFLLLPHTDTIKANYELCSSRNMCKSRERKRVENMPEKLMKANSLSYRPHIY